VEEVDHLAIKVEFTPHILADQAEVELMVLPQLVEQELLDKVIMADQAVTADAVVEAAQVPLDPTQALTP
jgi:hypothetical protein